MIDVLYSQINTAGISVDGAIRAAAKMGFRLTAFEGWSDSDLGRKYGEGKGPSRDAANENLVHIKFINEHTSAFAVLDTDGVVDGFAKAR